MHNCPQLHIFLSQPGSLRVNGRPKSSSARHAASQIRCLLARLTLRLAFAALGNSNCLRAGCSVLTGTRTVRLSPAHGTAKIPPVCSSNGTAEYFCRLRPRFNMQLKARKITAGTLATTNIVLDHIHTTHRTASILPAPCNRSPRPAAPTFVPMERTLQSISDCISVWKPPMRPWHHH
jgi:hypothetical protein